MINRFFFYTVLLLLSLLSFSCSKKEEDELVGLKILQQDLTLASQADIETFLALHEDAKALTIVGDVVIGKPVDGGESSDISSLEGLAKLVEVRGDLTLSMNEQLLSSKGLENLERVRNTLRLTNNPLLQSLGLLNLKRTDSLVISENSALLNLTDFDSLQRIGTLEISNNPLLQSLNGLEELDSLNNLRLVQNSKILDLEGLNGLQKIKGELHISQHPQLLTLAGLEQVALAHSFSITGNPKLLQFCAIRTAVAALLERNPDLTPEQIAELIVLQNNGKSPYSYQELLQECAE